MFSLFYVLPTFFNSDLDRGFSIIDYNINTDLVQLKDISDLEELNIKLKIAKLKNIRAKTGASSRYEVVGYLKKLGTWNE